MKRMLMVLLAIIVAAPALGACPHEIGLFSTYDDTMDPGRASEAWCAGAWFDVGNELNTQSWDGGALGDQWKVFGMAINASGAVLVESNVDENGTGEEHWVVDYDGGEFWFSKDHTWGDGISDLYGTVGMYHVAATVSYVQGNLVGQTANISWNGTFSACPEDNDCVVEFAIANSMLVWRSDMGLPEPVDYPGMLCGSEGHGELHDQCCITMMLNCTTATETIDWSSLKANYR